MFDRFVDWRTCEAALTNPDSAVAEIAMGYLREPASINRVTASGRPREIARKSLILKAFTAYKADHFPKLFTTDILSNRSWVMQRSPAPPKVSMDFRFTVHAL
jgi:hypothetical protein